MRSSNDSRMIDNEKADLATMMSAWFIKIVPPFAVGVTAKLANDIREGRRMHLIGWVAVVCMSLSAAFFSNWLCESYHVSKNNTVLINAFSTLFSEQIFKIISYNFFTIVQGFVKENLKITLKAMDKVKDDLSSDGDNKE